MRRWGPTLGLVVGLVAASLWAAAAYGQGRSAPGRRADVPGIMLPLLLRGVDLTPEQKTRVQEIMAAHRATSRALLDQMRAAREELGDRLLTPGGLQAEDVSPQVQRIAQLREQLMQEGLRATLEIRGVLTAEQLAKAAQVKARMQALRAEMRTLLGGQR